MPHLVGATVWSDFSTRCNHALRASFFQMLRNFREKTPELGEPGKGEAQGKGGKGRVGKGALEREREQGKGKGTCYQGTKIP